MGVGVKSEGVAELGLVEEEVRLLESYLKDQSTWADQVRGEEGHTTPLGGGWSDEIKRREAGGEEEKWNMR